MGFDTIEINLVYLQYDQNLIFVIIMNLKYQKEV